MTALTIYVHMSSIADTAVWSGSKGGLTLTNIKPDFKRACDLNKALHVIYVHTYIMCDHADYV